MTRNRLLLRRPGGLSGGYMKKHPVLPVLLVLLLLCCAGKAESPDNRGIRCENVRKVFTVPVLFGSDPKDLRTVYYRTGDLIYCAGCFAETGDYVEEIIECAESTDFLEDYEYARKVLVPPYVTDGPFCWRTFNDFPADPNRGLFHRELEDYVSFDLFHEETVSLDGHAALLSVWHIYDSEGVRSGTLSSILYARNDTILLISFITGGRTDGVSAEILREAAAQIGYDESKADVTAADGAFTLRTADGESYAFSGKSRQLAVDFVAPDKVARKAASVAGTAGGGKQDLLEWSVLDAGTKEPVAGISVNGRYLLSVNRGLKEARKVEVTAESAFFHAKAILPLTVYPVVSKIIPDSGEVFLYAGTGASETVTVRLEPESAVPIGITWKARKDGIVAISAGDDGSAVLTPVASGTTPVMITAPGGKNARVNVSVVTPVEQVELALSGRPVPGGRVTVKPALLPKDAGNKRTEWSLNVDGSVAVIDAKGQVRISGQAAAGTVITVTCRALGAPEPVVSEIEFEVGEP